MFLNENVWVLLQISLRFVPKGPINNMLALVQIMACRLVIMAWRRPGDKPLSGPMMVRSLTHTCVPWPQWVNLQNGDTSSTGHICFSSSVPARAFLSVHKYFHDPLEYFASDRCQLDIELRRTHPIVSARYTSYMYHGFAIYIVFIRTRSVQFNGCNTMWGTVQKKNQPWKLCYIHHTVTYEY